MQRTLFQLGKRLGLCASFVRPGCRMADIGTDHAYLPVWLARRGLIASAVAADVREGPLNSARRNISRYGVEGIVSARLSDGLAQVSPQEADDVVIAGMGGELAARIIGEAPWLKGEEKRLILQPMSSAEELRRFLLREGYCVLREEAAEEDGHVYSAMLCRYAPEEAGLQAADAAFPYIGLVEGRTGGGQAYLLAQQASLSRRAGGLRCEGNAAQARRLEEIRGLIESRLNTGKGMGLDDDSTGDL